MTNTCKKFRDEIINMAFDGKTLAIVALVLFIAFMLFKPQGSKFTLEGAPLDDSTEPAKGAAVEVSNKTRQMKMTGNEVSSTASDETGADVQRPPAALLPNEVPVTDDFGQFSTETILSGQNYLDPRSQIGYPETVGGTLRNANLQIRSEPSNPRDPVSIWNMSTITPETMRPLFEIQDKEYA